MMSATESSLAFMHKTAATRDPRKRQVKVIDQLQFDLAALGSDEEDDVDYTVGEDSSDGDLDDSGDDDESGEQSDSDQEETSEEENDETVDLPPSTSTQSDTQLPDESLNPTVFCCLCLNTKHSSEEMLECDKCGLVVHEDCYGIADGESLHSASSSSSTEPWFCDVCTSGAIEPSCELCPNFGGAMKETDCGRWVHLLCALYCGCTFGDVDKLSPVCMFELDYERFGAKTCCLCLDKNFARTGICITCDAGMCKFGYFHVTCAQRMGLLFVPTTAGDTVSADPYFANCPAHMDKTEMKARRRAYEKMEKTAFLKQKAKAAKPLNNREKLKLERKQQRMKEMKNSKPTPWLPTTEKWPRLLHTNAEVVRGMMLKAKLHNMSIGEGTDCAEGAHISRIDFAAAKASGKAISVPLSLSADFIAYYSQRETDIQELRHQLEHLKSKNEKLKAQQNHKLQGAEREGQSVQSFIEPEAIQFVRLLQILHSMGRSTKIKLPIDLRDLLVKCHLKVKDIPDSAKKLKNGYKVAMNGRNDGKKKMEIETPEIHTCAECKKSADQHLMIDCDTCQFFYHIACLDPPLTHVPVKAQQWGWECSKCAESDSEEESDTTLDLDTPRQLRTFRKPVQRLSISSPDHRRKMHPHVRMKSPLHTNGLRSPSIVSCQKDETEPNFLNLITFVGSIAVKSFSSQPTPSTSQFASPGKSISRKRKASEEVSITSPVKLEIDVPKVSVSLPNGVPNKIQVPTGEIRKRKPRRFVSRGKAEITEELLATAVNEVLDAGATANSVSKKYGIPKSTLRNHVLKNARLRGLEGRNLQELSAHSSEDTGEEDIVVAID